MAKAEKKVRKYKYTRMESAILGVLRASGKGKKFTTTDLIDKIYDKSERPLAARQSVMSIINILIRKVEENEEDYRIGRTSGMGPVPNEFWLEGKS